MFAWKLNQITTADNSFRPLESKLGISAYHLKPSEIYAGRLRSGAIGIWSRTWYDHPLVTHRHDWPPAVYAWKSAAAKYGNYETDPRLFSQAVIHVTQTYGISASNGLCCMKTNLKSIDDVDSAEA